MSYAIEAENSHLNFQTRFSNFRRRFKLSSQISLTYALILFVTLIVTNVGTTAGVYYVFHHQAERALDISIERTTQKVRELNAIDENFYRLGTVMPSVVFRVVDESGKVITDTNPYIPNTEKFLKYVRNDPPFWASNEYKLVETPHSFFYYKDLPLEVGGKIFHFQFFKTITFEKDFIRYLLWTIFFVDVIGLGLAMAAGYLLSRRILKPLKHVTETAREISAGNLDKRLDVEKSGDEVSKLSKSFNKMLDRLEESFTRQQRFIADASHELRTPITVIRGYAEMLELYGAEDKELLEESAASIKNSAQNMQYLVESMLFLARADQETQPLNKSPVEIRELINSVVKRFKNPRVKFICEKEFETSGDPELLKKLFAIFLDNALKYSNDEVKIEMAVENQTATVKFIDKGIGISFEDRQKIFDRFFRVDKSRTKFDDEKISAGLGLSIAKWIADKHEIKISVDSELDKGTTFELTVTQNFSS